MGLLKKILFSNKKEVSWVIKEIKFSFSFSMDLLGYYYINYSKYHESNTNKKDKAGYYVVQFFILFSL